MAEAMARLPADMQRVLVGRHVDGLPHAVLARQLGRTPAATAGLIKRGMQALRRQLRRDG